ncbi:MAG: GDP-mannose 4,6-dehydratase [bacterium]
MAAKSNKRAFVTGIAGFAGSWLAERLLAEGYEVHGALAPGEPTGNLAAITGKLKLVRLDIRQARKCLTVLARIKPSSIFHLAAFASVGRSFEQEREVYRVNVEGTLNILQASLGLDLLKRFVFVSSPDCYGLVLPRNRTLTETDPLAPVSPYGISKAAAEQICLGFFRRHGLPVVVARAFNHTGPRQSPDFAVPSLARQIAMIETGKQRPVIMVGNLSAKRDLSDVRDIVRGYQLLAERGRPGQVYHLCRGRAMSIRSVLNRLVSLSDRPIKVGVDAAKLRPVDIPVLRGSFDKASQEVGFEHRYTFMTTLVDTLNYWREILNK